MEVLLLLHMSMAVLRHLLCSLNSSFGYSFSCNLHHHFTKDFNKKPIDIKLVSKKKIDKQMFNRFYCFSLSHEHKNNIDHHNYHLHNIVKYVNNEYFIKKYIDDNVNNNKYVAIQYLKNELCHRRNHLIFSNNSKELW